MRPLLAFVLNIILGTTAITSCTKKTSTASNSIKKSTSMTPITTTSFGTLATGEKVMAYKLQNKKGTELTVINYGGIITSLKVADRTGKTADIVLGFANLNSYNQSSPYLGALIGRYGNRIAKGRFELDGSKYTLAVNNIGNHLHGGLKGFDKVFWNIEEVKGSEPALKLTYLSRDMEEGYPGNVKIEVLYRLTDNNELKIDYKATTDKATVVNLTQHSYFNLTGNEGTSILGHELLLYSDKFLPVDSTLIPTGKLADVEGTAFDFRKITPMGTRIHKDDQQLKFGLGYDHCWVLNKEDSNLAARVYEPVSGRTMEVYTSEPGIQFYSGNFLDGTLTGKGGKAFAHRSGFCLETQHFPDSPNQSAFPSTTLRPGQTYSTNTTYKFGVQ